MVTPDFRRRFLREAEAASRLDHPAHRAGLRGGRGRADLLHRLGVLRGTDAGRVAARADGRPVPIRGGPAGGDPGRGGRACPRAGILHRDLKPGNILLQRLRTLGVDGRACRAIWAFFPRICDFGLAKLLDQASQETCSGVPIGSAELHGARAGRRPAARAWARDRCLCAGRDPLRAPDGAAAIPGETDLETLRLVSDQEPLSPRALRPGLPRDLETITLKCLEKRPIQSLLQRNGIGGGPRAQFLDGKPIHARPAPLWKRLRMWVKRRPVHATLALVIALAVSSIVGMFVWSGAWLRWHQEDKQQAVLLAERDTQRHERSAHEARIQESACWITSNPPSSPIVPLNSQVKLIHETLETGERRAGGDDAGGSFRRAGPARDRMGFAWRYLARAFPARNEPAAPRPA